MTPSITIKKISKITVKHMTDENPMLDWLGTFDDEAKSELAINHRERSGLGNRTIEWFNPQPGACENKEHAEQDYKRMMQFENGDVSSLGIKAVAEILTSNDNGKSWLRNEISSGGLWGIESDSGENYFNEISCEQQRELLPLLVAFGFTVDEIEAAPLVEEKL